MIENKCSLEHITLQGLVKVPFSIEMLGGVFIQSISSHCSQLGGLLHLKGHFLEVFPPSRGHGQHLSHAGSLQVVNLVKRHVNTGEEEGLIIERCSLLLFQQFSCFSARKPEFKNDCITYNQSLSWEPQPERKDSIDTEILCI